MARFRAVIDGPGSSAGPAMARHVVAAVLDGWQLSSRRDGALLVVSELVTNAITHAAGADSYELALERGDGTVRMSLADGSSIAPVIRELRAGQPGGLGLRLVRMLASRWGCEQHHGGKRVWVELELDTAEGDAPC